MDDIEITSQAKQAAMLAVMAAGDATNRKAWRDRVQAQLPMFAALVREDYGYWGREAQGILDAAVFRATYHGYEMEESSKRLIVQLRSDTTAKGEAESDGTERLRTERTDTPPGWHMKRRLDAIDMGGEVTVWKKVETISGSKKVRVLVHIEAVPSRSDSGERPQPRPSAGPPSLPVEDEGPTRSSPSGDGTAPEGQLSPEAKAVQLAMADLSARQRLAVKARCVGEGIEHWTDPGPEDIDRVLTIMKEVGGG